MVLDLRDDLLEQHLPLRGVLRDQPRDLRVPLLVQRGEGEVLQLPLDRVHAQAVGERGEDLEGLARLLLLLLGRQEREGPHVVQAVGELDDEHPRVLGHRDDHLADRLGLRRVAELHLVELGDAVDQEGDLAAELLGELVELVVGVLDGVVQERGHERVRVHAQLGQDRGDRQRVGDVRVPGLAELPVVQLFGPRVRLLEQPHVGARVRGPVGGHERLEDLGELR